MKARKRMTKTELYNLLPKKGWTVNDGELRRKGVCPVCAVANKLLHKTGKKKFTEDFEVAARAINLPYSTAMEIVFAADWLDNAGRCELLQACGLKEVV